MTKYLITMKSSKGEKRVESDEQTTLLEAIKSTNLPAIHPCRNGVCGLCRCRLLSGEITYNGREPHGLWERDKVEGFILPCIAYAMSDLSIDRLSLEKE